MAQLQAYTVGADVPEDLAGQRSPYSMKEFRDGDYALQCNGTCHRWYLIDDWRANGNKCSVHGCIGRGEIVAARQVMPRPQSVADLNISIRNTPQIAPSPQPILDIRITDAPASPLVISVVDDIQPNQPQVQEQSEEIIVITQQDLWISETVKWIEGLMVKLGLYDSLLTILPRSAQARRKVLLILAAMTMVVVGLIFFAVASYLLQ